MAKCEIVVFGSVSGKGERMDQEMVVEDVVIPVSTCRRKDIGGEGISLHLGQWKRISERREDPSSFMEALGYSRGI